MRRASRTDSNHTQITAAARKLGFQVVDLSKVGSGCPDLLLYRPQTRSFTLVEVKVAKGRINALQADFAARWPVKVVRSVDDLLSLLK